VAVASVRPVFLLQNIFKIFFLRLKKIDSAPFKDNKKFTIITTDCWNFRANPENSDPADFKINK
jgi:hypothetical protein